MEDRKELIKALELIKKTCKSVPSKDRNNMRKFGNCPIHEILGDCTQEEVPEDWIIRGGFHE